MKNKLIKILPFLGFILLMGIFYSCRKEVPSSKIDYVGRWESTDGQSGLTIHSNGEATWEVVPGSGGRSLSGKITFTSSGFYIKRFFSKETFSVNQEPTPLPYATMLGDYTHVAVFNNIEYYKF